MSFLFTLLLVIAVLASSSICVCQDAAPGFIGQGSKRLLRPVNTNPIGLSSSNMSVNTDLLNGLGSRRSLKSIGPDSTPLSSSGRIFGRRRYIEKPISDPVSPSVPDFIKADLLKTTLEGRSLGVVMDLLHLTTRPMLKAFGRRDEELARFSWSEAAEVYATNRAVSPFNLISQVSNRWDSIHLLSSSVVYFPNARPSGASGFLIRSNLVVTASHVVKLTGTNTIVRWPDKSGFATGVKRSVELVFSDTNVDLAVFRANGLLPRDAVFLDLGDESIEIYHPVVTIGYPSQYGEIFGKLSDDLLGDLGDLRLSPGLVRSEMGLQASYSHDCASDAGSSGGPVISLISSKVIGVHLRFGVQANSNDPLNSYLSASFLIDALRKRGL